MHDTKAYYVVYIVHIVHAYSVRIYSAYSVVYLFSNSESLKAMMYFVDFTFRLSYIAGGVRAQSWATRRRGRAGNQPPDRPK